MKIDEDNKSSFVDKDDRAVMKRLLSSLREKGVKQFKMTIEPIDNESLTDKQKSLFKLIVVKIAEYSGNDYKTVEKTLLESFLQKNHIENFSKKDFSDFMNWVVPFTNEFFDLGISVDKNGFITVNHNRQ